MHRTLFTSSMVETFRLCKRAYQLAYVQYQQGNARQRISTICKQFILKGLAEINKGKLSTVHDVQKFMGQNWPVEKIGDGTAEKDNATKAFLFAYKTLVKYVSRPFKPDGAQIVAVALKVRVRVPHVRVYLEDTLDLVLWYPNEKRLELVDFSLHPVKPIDPLWPNAQILTKQYLAERLKARWPFERLTLTFCRVGTQEFLPVSIIPSQSIFEVHWPELVKALDEMKDLSDPEDIGNHSCERCDSLKHNLGSGFSLISLSA